MANISKEVPFFLSLFYLGKTHFTGITMAKVSEIIEKVRFYPCEMLSFCQKILKFFGEKSFTLLKNTKQG